MSNEALIKFLQAGHTFEIEDDGCGSPVIVLHHASNKISTGRLDIYSSSEVDDVCSELMSRPEWQEEEGNE